MALEKMAYTFGKAGDIRVSPGGTAMENRAKLRCIAVEKANWQSSWTVEIQA
jgi:hypothetical protein